MLYILWVLTDLECVWVLQRNGTWAIALKRSTVGLQRLSCPPCVPSASWRMRKASGRIQIQSEGLRSSGADDITLRLDLGGGKRCSDHPFITCQHFEECLTRD